MGVSICLSIMPDHIDGTEWGKVYEETLEIINSYPFLDSIFDEETYEYNWKYLVRTKERAVKYADNQIGWHTIGDEKSLKMAESFALIKDFQYYQRNGRQVGNCEDILFSSIYKYPKLNEHLERLHVNEFRVFDSKTQGEPYHIPILAIACLIESRFPRHAIVSGDISIGQMEKAVKWANSILERPIALTERADNEKLLVRIKKEVNDEAAALEALMCSTIRVQDEHLGNLVRTHFKPETIAAYYLSEFKGSRVGTLGFSTDLTHYFNQGFRLEDACQLCVLDPNGCNYDATKFAQSILRMEWGTKGKDFISTKINDPDSSDPETVDSLLGKVFLQMAGFQESLESNLSFEEVTHILRAELGDICDIDALVDKMNESQNEQSVLLDEFRAELKNDREDDKDKKEVSEVQYTATYAGDLCTWKTGDTIHPHLEEGLAKVKEFVEGLLIRDQEFFDGFRSMTAKDKMKKMISYNRYFYIHKRVWDEILATIDDVRMTERVLGVLSIQADEMNINKLCKYLMNNQELFKAYIL